MSLIFNKMEKKDFLYALPGMAMGCTRAIISHPFEIMKMKSQLGIQQHFYRQLFRGLHYSILANSLERSLQFGIFEKIKRQGESNFVSSAKASLISSSINLPYNIILLRTTSRSSSNKKISKAILGQGLALEYSRNLIGSSLFLYSYSTLKDQQVPVYIRAPLASCLVWGVTYPLDSVKNQLLAHKPIRWQSLYQGIQYPLIRSFPSSIIGFWVYESCLDYVRQWDV